MEAPALDADATALARLIHGAGQSGQSKEVARRTRESSWIWTSPRLPILRYT